MKEGNNMQDTINMNVIAHMQSDFHDKFGIPRQSGLVKALRSRIVFTPEYRSPEAVRGLQDFSHLWVIWQFSKAVRDGSWSPTVRPPRLGGNTRMGVFATRSPYRPNAIGLSCVEIVSVEPDTPEGPVITVAGADLLDGTPILDIKPYIPYADSFPSARGGFTDSAGDFLLDVDFPEALLARVPEESREALLGVLSHDPRPAYQRTPERIYGLSFASVNVKFRVEDKALHVLELDDNPRKPNDKDGNK